MEILREWVKFSQKTGELKFRMFHQWFKDWKRVLKSVTLWITISHWDWFYILIRHLYRSYPENPISLWHNMSSSLKLKWMLQRQPWKNCIPLVWIQTHFQNLVKHLRWSNKAHLRCLTGVWLASGINHPDIFQTNNFLKIWIYLRGDVC